MPIIHEWCARGPNCCRGAHCSIVRAAGCVAAHKLIVARPGTKWPTIWSSRVARRVRERGLGSRSQAHCRCNHLARALQNKRKVAWWWVAGQTRGGRATLLFLILVHISRLTETWVPRIRRQRQRGHWRRGVGQVECVLVPTELKVTPVLLGLVDGIRVHRDLGRRGHELQGPRCRAGRLPRNEGCRGRDSSRRGRGDSGRSRRRGGPGRGGMRRHIARCRPGVRTRHRARRRCHSAAESNSVRHGHLFASVLQRGGRWSRDRQVWALEKGRLTPKQLGNYNCYSREQYAVRWP